MTSTNIRLLRPEPYSGTSLGIVIGIDVGTTFSGVSYSILRPGEIPEVLSVTKFSGQTITGAKIPSVIFYDQDLKIRAIGSQIDQYNVQADADTEKWIKAEHFKLHLRPPEAQLKFDGFKVGDLPRGKTAEQVFGDYLRYLHSETADFIKQGHSDGEKIWGEVKDRAIFVLGHPNGWKGLPQQRYRSSAILGGLVPDTDEGRRRIRFVTEGEASALSCLSGGLAPSVLRAGFRFVIADAGGGTIDCSTFEVTKTSPVELIECVPPDGRFAGSVFVNKSAQIFLEEKFQDTKYADEQIMKDVLDSFESKTKREFNGGDGFLRVGGRSDRNAALGIAGGFLKLSSSDIMSFFSHSMSGLVDAVTHQLTSSESNRSSTPVWLVGGFAASPYLLSALQDAFKFDGISVQCLETNLAKAVANGAVLHYLDNLVTTRACDGSYGIQVRVPYNSSNTEHQNHLDILKHYFDGEFLDPVFSCIVQKNTAVGVHQTFKESYYRKVYNKERAREFSTNLYCYQGDPPVPFRFEEDKPWFREVCELRADLYELATDASFYRDSFLGPGHWKLFFDVEIKFGSTEFEAAIVWKVGGVTKRGPVTIVHTGQDLKTLQHKQALTEEPTADPLPKLFTRMRLMG